MSVDQQKTPKVPEDVIATGKAQAMASGSLIRLRAVQEEDLATLSALLAQTPCPRELVPWTTQRLKKKFDAEKEPGFWSDKKKIYLAVRLSDGKVVGFIDERERSVCRDLHLHVADCEPDRDELGREMLAMYMRLILDWYNQVRIEAFVLACEEQKQQWLAAAGFEHEVTYAEYYMHQGRSESLHIWGWVNPRLENGAGS